MYAMNRNENRPALPGGKKGSIFRPGFIEGNPFKVLEASAEAVVTLVFTPLMRNGGPFHCKIRRAVRMQFLKPFLLRFGKLFQVVCPKALQ